MALVTAAQVREHYPSLTGTGEDTLLNTLITRADGLMAAYCGYPACDSGHHTLEDETYTLYLEAAVEDPRVLRLPVRPLQSVTSANVDATWDHAAATAVSAADYLAVAIDGALYAKPTGSLQAWSTELRSNKVVVVAGFATTPPALVAIAAMAVRDLLDAGKVGQQTSGSSSRQSYSRPEAGSLLSLAVRGSLDAGYAMWSRRVH